MTLTSSTNPRLCSYYHRKGVNRSQVEVEDLSFTAGFFRQLVEEAVRPSSKLRTSDSSCSIFIGREMRFLL